jgi:hypothetical protein
MIKRRQFLRHSLVAGIATSCIHLPRFRSEAAEPANSTSSELAYRLKLETPARRFDGKESFCHPRAGIVPGIGKDGQPRVVMTMNTIDLSGNDVYKAMYGLHTDDLGKTWTEPVPVPPLCYRMETIDRVERPVAASDFWPKWHRQSKTLLGTGHTVAYTPQWKVVDDRPRDTSFAVYDAAKGEWLPWRKMPMNDDPQFAFAGAGSTQRYDQPDGTILLPMYYRISLANRTKRVTVMRCSFDGKTLKYLDHGDEIILEDGTRGIGEPSLTFFNGTYYMTLRHPQRGYVTTSRDGLHFEPIRPWTFDDGNDLGSYETQQHWVTHSDGLYLVYTRRGANNDHVFRNRAPLFMAQVDPDRLVVLRATEVELMPNRGARYGNFGVTDVSRDETWVTESEWMQPKGVEKYGSDGRVYVARINWSKPNAYF